MSQTSRRIIFRLVMGLGITIFVLVVAAATLAPMAANSGEQISIDGFERRRFSYFEIFGKRLSATNYFNSTGNLETMLSSNSWIKDSGKPSKNKTWITATHIRRGSSYQSDSQILVAYLNMAGNGGPVDLHRWSSDHPGLAAAMWKEIQIAADGDMFILIPDMVHAARNLTPHQPKPASKPNPLPETKEKEDPQKSAKELVERERKEKKVADKKLLPLYVQLYMDAAANAEAASLYQRAHFCLEQVLRLSPDHPSAQKLLEALPEPDVEEIEVIDEPLAEDEAES